MPENQVPVTLGLWLVALLPLAAILILLVGLRWKAATAAPVGYLLAVLAALTVFQASPRIVALQTVKGVWDALFIIYVIVPALFLYEVSQKAGAFDTLQHGIEAFTPNNLLHILAFGWVFASFLQGITGFGAPIAVTAPLLVAVGVQPLWAVAIPLIGHAWANTFGTLAVAWEGMRLVTEVPDPGTTALWAAIMLTLANLAAGITIGWLYGRGRGIREALPAIVVVGGIHGVGQLVLAPLLPTISVFIPGTLAVGAILWLAKSRWYSDSSEVNDSPVMEPGAQEERGRDVAEAARQFERIPLWLAFAPYVALIALIVVALLIPSVRQALEALEIGLPFLELETGLGVVTEAEEAYSAFSPLTHPGTFLLASGIIAYALFRARGQLARPDLGAIAVDTIRSSIPSALALLALVPLATVMSGSGQIIQLALGIAAIATGPVYALSAPFIGALGGFMTSSNLSSNILFAELQRQTAATLGISVPVILAAQTSGGAVANCVAPSNVLLGVGAVGLTGRTGDVIRITVMYALIAVALAGAVALLGVLLFGGTGG